MAPGLGLGTAIPKIQYLSEASTVSEYSLALDGTTDYVTFTEYAYTITGADTFLSIAFWAKRTDNSDEAVVLGHSGSGAFKRLYFDSDGDALIIESDTNGQDASAPVTADTNWHHYAIIISGVDGGSASTVTMYEDGAAISVTNTNFGTSTADLTLNRIGDDNADGNQAFKGLLYQVAIYDILLGGDEIERIYNSGDPIPLEENSGKYITSLSLQNLWKFTEGTGTSVADSGGLNRTGTITNATWSSTTPS